MVQLVLFIVGLAGLYFGAEWLVRGAVRLARMLGVSPLVAGLTIVAFGTSAPELTVSVIAALGNQGDLAVGNVIGSNIANVALILGLAALIQPLRAEMRLLSREVPFMIVTTIGLGVVLFDREVGRVDAAVLLGTFLAYTWYLVRASRQEAAAVAAEYEEFEDVGGLTPRDGSRLMAALLALLGLIVLVGGARLLVDSATYFARIAGLSERVIGLTIVAIGTSLPEVATVIVAALRKEADIALGAAVGSNIFNTLVILGVAGLVRPLSATPALLLLDLPVMIVTCILLLPLVRTRMLLARWEGLLLVTGYAAYLAVLLLRPE